MDYNNNSRSALNNHHHNDGDDDHDDNNSHHRRNDDDDDQVEEEARVHDAMNHNQEDEDGDEEEEDATLAMDEDDDDEDNEEDEEEDEDNIYLLAMEEQEEARNAIAMLITDQERTWALEIKQAVEESPDLKALSDLEYAHHAIVAKGNLREALHRIQGLQWFKEEYHVDDSAEQGIYYLEQYVQLQPGAFLNLDICSDTGEGIVAVDLSAIRPAVAMECRRPTSPDDVLSMSDADQNWKIHIVAYYYARLVVQPNLKSVREKTICLMDGYGMDWNNLHLAYETRLNHELWAYYPIEYQKIMVYNTNTVITLFWSLMKPLMTTNMKNTIEMGCQLERQVVFNNHNNQHDETTTTTSAKLRLRDLYVQPTLEVANRYLLERARQLLTRRTKNREAFRL